MYREKVLIAGLHEDQVRTLDAAISWCSFERYEELPEDPVEREKLHRTFNATFYFGEYPRWPELPDHVKDLHRFEEVVEDEPYEEHADPDYYDYTGSTASENAASRRMGVLDNILRVLRYQEEVI